MSRCSLATTCRFCGVQGERRNFVKYGVRHHAHHECYLGAGKKLDALHDWQVLQFPYRILQKFRLLDVAVAASTREEQRKNGDGARGRP